jgi:hypothetical protein
MNNTEISPKLYEFMTENNLDIVTLINFLKNYRPESDEMELFINQLLNY